MTNRVNVEEVSHPDGRVIVFVIPSRPIGTPLHVKGAYLMRSGEALVPMSQDQLKRIFEEARPDWLTQIALANLSVENVVDLLDTQKIFELLNLPYPESPDVIVDRLLSLGLVTAANSAWSITNLGAIIGARKLSSFPPSIALRKPRFILYSGSSKVSTIREFELDRGLAVGFQEIVVVVLEASPLNRVLEEVVRVPVKVFQPQSIRELIANSFVHQDFTIEGSRVMIEMYSDRVEISNPGLPSIEISRFIDGWKSRNESLADLMRRMGICEEKGSGVDKVVSAAEALQLPAPKFLISDSRTISILFAPRDFSRMSRADRLRACYQHCVLRYVMRQPMTNQSLRERFGLDARSSGVVSDIISATKNEGLIAQEPGSTTSTRYAQYIPSWAVSL